MDQKHRERWQKVRAKGKARYVMLYGVVPSLLIGVVITLAAYAFWPWEKYSDDPSRGSLPLLSLVISVLSGSVVGGYIAGARIWGATEKQYDTESDESER